MQQKQGNKNTVMAGFCGYYVWWSYYIKIAILVMLLQCEPTHEYRRPSYKPLKVKPVPELIRYEGYPTEVHRVKAEDGYILELHRIPGGKFDTATNQTLFTTRKVVLMVHCIFCTSAIWVMQGAKKGLGYMLADDGYDVWMLNLRGSTHSKQHVKYSTKSKHYWKFSWHEMAVYDLPVTIDYILEVTKQDQLDYIGYSMGTTLFFALMSYRPEMNHKIRKMIALAPATYLSSARGIMLYISVFIGFLERFFNDMEQYEVPPKALHIKETLQRLCDSRNTFLRGSCDTFFQLAVGSSNRNLQLKKLPYYFSYFPDTTSLRTVIHFYQVRNTGKFQMYDYGRKKNLETYGSVLPPLYNLSQVTTPVHLFYAKDDTVTTPADIAHLRSQLPNVALNFEVTVPHFSHADFGWGKNVKDEVYDVVMEALNY